MKIHFTLLIISTALLSCEPNTKKSKEKGQWNQLWDGETFEGWHTYLGPPYEIYRDSIGNNIDPFGIDNDPLGVITVASTNEGNAIRISGVAWGMIYTEKDFKNYHLRLKAKWGNDKHPPRANERRDSGLLYHGFGAPGSAYSWMSSQELQVQEGDMGDYWPVGDVEIDIPSKPMDSTYYIYDQNSALRTYYFADILPTATDDSLAKRRVFKEVNTEKPHGEWNYIELITLGDSSIHIVNGKVVMRLYNSRTMTNKDPLKSGKIILQSEGAEVFYKDLEIRSIDAIPEKYKLNQ